ncbi:MAG: sigma-54 dependent transcriptional regulator [Planctomycetota bacterium]|jgi:DNA-binding NtrC family response regulator|nr:sigma-54 dependent transcriptional regulator [Planctomycetota bacterium]
MLKTRAGEAEPGTAGRLLIVDDNQGVFESLEMNFRRGGVSCLWAANREEAMAAARNNAIYAAIIDLSLGSESGLVAMQSLLTLCPGLPVVFISGYGTLEAAVAAVKLGAYDFLTKPLNFAKLKSILAEAVAAKGKGEERLLAGSPPAGRLVVAENGAMQQILHLADRVMESDLPLLITGESGVGKDLLAEYLHQKSSRRDRPFVRVNCSAISDSLAESELFGHVKGSFTGAWTDHPGFFEQADRGSIHLDEIGDMTPATQARVLRVIEDRRLRRVGGTVEQVIQVRIIASTNKDLEALTATGNFRQDLYYRLNAVGLHVPPLRERPEDLELLVEHFLAEEGLNPPRHFSPAARQCFRDYSWPGNVRELRNVVKASILLNPDLVVDIKDLPRSLRESRQPSGRLDVAECAAVKQALRESGGNKKQAAGKLGISLRTLYYKLDRYGIKGGE